MYIKVDVCYIIDAKIRAYHTFWGEHCYIYCIFYQNEEFWFGSHMSFTQRK